MGGEGGSEPAKDAAAEAAGASASIARGTEEVRLEDLGRKGITRVRVLRPSDIERMIRHVLAEALLADTKAGDELVKATRESLIRRMKEAQAQIAAGDRVEAEIDRRRAANSKLAAEVTEERGRLKALEAELAEAVADAEQLERDGSEIQEAIASLGGAR